MTSKWLKPIYWLIILLLTTQTLLSDRYTYSYIPKKIYSTQVFPVTILAKDVDKSDPPRFIFDTNSPNHPLDSVPIKVLNGDDIFYTFYFQVDSNDSFLLPQLSIRETLVTNTLPKQLLKVEKLNTSEDNNFSGLIASDCTMLSSQISMFDSKNTLVSIKFKAHEANPDAIHIPGSIEEGLEKIIRKESLISAEYYFVIPSSKKSVTLSYYNTVQHRFVPITIKTDYRNKPVAAQVELNPQASHFDKLKKYGSMALAMFFGLMYWWKRDYLYLILLISVSYLVYSAYKPNEQLCIRQGSPLYILPTHNSRVSTNIKNELHVNSLGSHGDYYKIVYDDGTIGWINHENICED